VQCLRIWNCSGWIWRVVFIAIFIFFLVPNLNALFKKTSQKTQKLVASTKYKVSGIHEWFLGKNYRDLWMTSIEVDLLDLQTYAGGLQPVMRVGGMQTLGLALNGSDGRSYTFRGVEKNPKTFLPPSFQDTLAERLIKDQTSAVFPGAAVIVPPIAKAAGILHVQPKLVVMPDDPGLGEFRETFAGALGTLEEYPRAKSDSHPGTFGAIEILSSEEMWSQILASSENRIDSRAFLRARLVDVLLGDWDRHQRQWRWAKLPGKPKWQPIPEDRDRVFCTYEGFILTLARLRYPMLVRFKPSYPHIEGLTWNGREVDRKVLTDLELPVWRETAKDIQRLVTDEVLEEALHRLPREYIDLRGDEILNSLKQRRSNLQDEAERFYRHLAKEVDIHCTNQKDFAEIQREDNGDIEVKISRPVDSKKSGKYYFQRKFHKKYTKEVRLYLYDSDDTVLISGKKTKGIKIRVIGGDGFDVVDDSRGGGIYFADSSGHNKMIKGRSSKFDPRPYKPIQISSRKHTAMSDNPLLSYRDWGRYTAPQIYPGFSSDIGLLLGGGVVSTGYAFRKFPYSDLHNLKVGYATKARSGIFDYYGDFRRSNSSLFGTVSVLFSGLEFLRFYGYGNDTEASRSDDKYKIRQRVLSVFPSVHYVFSPTVEVFGGLQFKYNTAADDPDTLLGKQRPYGYRNFGQMGLRLGIRWDTRDPSKANTSGFRAAVEGFVYPELLSADSTFSGFEGNAAAYISLAKPLILALSVGGKKIFGTFPYTEAAYIGGSSTLRGFHKNRFAGNASLYCQTELRLVLGKAVFIIPGEYGLFGLADVGRVYVDEESSNKWHPAYGGGVFYSVLDIATVFSLSIARSEEGTIVYFKAGFAF
jgi:hypothetical protein